MCLQVRPHCIAGMTSLLALTYGYRAPLSCSSSSNSSGNLMPDNASPEATPTRSLMSGNDTGRSHASISSSRATNVPARALQTTTAGRKPANYTAAAMVTSGAATVATAARGGTPAADVTGFNLGRLIDELRLLPTAGQLQLVDKKFGGERPSLLWVVTLECISYWNCCVGVALLYNIGHHQRIIAVADYHWLVMSSPQVHSGIGTSHFSCLALELEWKSPQKLTS